MAAGEADEVEAEVVEDPDVGIKESRGAYANP